MPTTRACTRRWRRCCITSLPPIITSTRAKNTSSTGFLKQEFDLDQDQVEHLYAAVKGSTADLHGDLHTINSYLKKNPVARMNFMQKLLQIVNIHGTHDGELQVFYEVLHEVFPEVKESGGQAL